MAFAISLVTGAGEDWGGKEEVILLS